MKGLGASVLGMLAGVGLLLTMGIGLALPPTAEQEEYARLIAVHPPLAWCAYLAFGTTAIASALWLVPRTRHPRFDRLAASSAEVGVVFTALTLATGMIWGRPTWGVWWTWDARLTLTAVMLFLYLGYLALRRAAPPGEARARRSAVAALAMVTVVPIDHFAVEWWRTLHQGRSLAALSPDRSLDGAYIAVMLVGFVTMTLVYAWLLLARYRLAEIEERAGEQVLAEAIAERRAEAVPTTVVHR